MNQHNAAKKKFSKIPPRSMYHLNAKSENPYRKEKNKQVKLRLHTAINRADFVSRCMLSTYEGDKLHLWENYAILSWVNH